MGTRGWIGHRYKRRFIYWYNPFDSYPSCLGLEILESIPGPDATPEEFMKWLVEKRDEMDRLCRENPEGTKVSGTRAKFSSDHPGGESIEWTYFADLDNLVFLINGMPLFRLDHLPPPEIFLDSIGRDHYNNCAYANDTPVEYRYNWTPPPPPPCVIGLTAYRNHASENPNRPIYEILAISEGLSRAEQSSTEVLEILVGNYMVDRKSAIFIHELENLSSRELMPQETKSCIFSLLSLSLYPKIFPRHAPTDVDSSHEFIWLHGRQGSLCLHITTHLDDQANLEAAVGKVVNEVLQKDGKGVVYGVAFSIFHCVVISVDVQSGGRCQHTSALQFLPSWYAESPSTPGIVALARLGYHIGFDLITDYGHVTILSSPAKRDSGGKFVLPADICDEIVQYLYDPIDILKFGSISPSCQVAATRILRYPHVANYRLLSHIRVPVASSKRFPHPQLYSANFEAVTDTRKVIIEVGPEWDPYDDDGRLKKTPDLIATGFVAFIASASASLESENILECEWQARRLNSKSKI